MDVLRPIPEARNSTGPPQSASSSSACGPSPAPSPSQDVPSWLYKIMKERAERLKSGNSDAGRSDDEDVPVHTTEGHAGVGQVSDDLMVGEESVRKDRKGEPEGRERRTREGDALQSDGEDQDVVLPEGLDVAPPFSRHSYGDFSSASSTTSSSASTSGFSSHSASSATTVSSTATFSAAGWSGQACPALVLKNLGLAPTDACSLEDVADCDTPSAENSVDTVRPLSEPASPLTAPPTGDETISPTSLSSSAPAASAPPSYLRRPVSPSTASVTSTVPTDQLSAASLPLDDSTLRPPENFAMVSPGLYRSSFPRRANFSFLRSLGLKSVMVLVQEPYPEENLEFLQAEGIQFFQIGIPGNKEPFVSIPDEKLVAAMSVALDSRNLPMLIHCNKGKHRTGCVVGCMRRLQSWSLTAVFEEYRRYSHPKSRALDLECIEAFGGLPEVWRTIDRQNLPPWAEPPDPPPPRESPSSLPSQ
ncbi:hypothetical protein JCM11251_007238 [Rhodosporidiobolus azoricus]